MSGRTLKICARRILLAGALVLLLSQPVGAADYVPYPGRIEADLVDIQAANVVVIRFETWPGFVREFDVTLRGIAVPRNGDRTPACERAMAAEALAFTREFLEGVKKVSIQDMSMKNSGERAAISSIGTEKGELGAALSKQNLARPSDVEVEKPWC